LGNKKKRGRAGTAQAAIVPEPSLCDGERTARVGRTEKYGPVPESPQVLGYHPVTTNLGVQRPSFGTAS